MRLTSQNLLNYASPPALTVGWVEGVVRILNGLPWLTEKGRHLSTAALGRVCEHIIIGDYAPTEQHARVTRINE